MVLRGYRGDREADRLIRAAGFGWLRLLANGRSSVGGDAFLASAPRKSSHETAHDLGLLHRQAVGSAWPIASCESVSDRCIAAACSTVAVVRHRRC